MLLGEERQELVHCFCGAAINTKAESHDELIGSRTKVELVARLEEELGVRLHDLLHLIDIIPDPWMDGVFAMRFRNPQGKGDVAYFLLTPDGVEQVETDCWLPKLL